MARDLAAPRFSALLEREDFRFVRPPTARRVTTDGDPASAHDPIRVFLNPGYLSASSRELKGFQQAPDGRVPWIPGTGPWVRGEVARASRDRRARCGVRISDRGLLTQAKDLGEVERVGAVNEGFLELAVRSSSVPRTAWWKARAVSRSGLSHGSPVTVISVRRTVARPVTSWLVPVSCTRAAMSARRVVALVEELVGEGEFVVGAGWVGEGGYQGDVGLGDGLFARGVVLFGFGPRVLEGGEGMVASFTRMGSRCSPLWKAPQHTGNSNTE
ncbi:hypothetical protein ACFVT5_42000 [Streptomyces sp. NPDC058001]|uniref:hypothetical protein n=1 Tax=Streptomyces sp. NPDC058001 TaxID=3346300 RepID=UPI0036E81C5F